MEKWACLLRSFSSRDGNWPDESLPSNGSPDESGCHDLGAAFSTRREVCRSSRCRKLSQRDLRCTAMRSLMQAQETRSPLRSHGIVGTPLEMRSNLQPSTFGPKVRTRGPRPSICVRTFSLFTIYQSIKSAKAKGGRCRCPFNQMQKLCKPILAAKRA